MKHIKTERDLNSIEIVSDLEAAIEKQQNKGSGWCFEESKLITVFHKTISLSD